MEVTIHREHSFRPADYEATKVAVTVKVTDADFEEEPTEQQMIDFARAAATEAMNLELNELGDKITFPKKSFFHQT